MLVLSHCTCTTGLLGHQRYISANPRPLTPAMFRDSLSCLGMALSPSYEGPMPWGKRRDPISLPPRKGQCHAVQGHVCGPV